MKKKWMRAAFALAVVLLLGLGISFSLQQLRPTAKSIPTTRVQASCILRIPPWWWRPR
jgi:hypothetical protein